MFKCQKCGETEFKLMVQPSFAGQIEIDTDDRGEILIRVGAREFQADLMFMNQFAVCKACDAIKSWAYHYPGMPEPAEMAEDA